MTMKKNYNSQKNEWYNEGSAIVRKLDNGGLFFGVPSVEQLTEWGFEEWVEPTPTQEQLLQMAKESKIAELESYDSSPDVNSFSIGGQDMWLNVEERQQIATQISANEAVGRESMTRWFGGQSFTFPLTVWKQMLTALEVYAGDALNVTERHRAAIEQLDTVGEIEEYDFTEGYPEKLNF